MILLVALRHESCLDSCNLVIVHLAESSLYIKVTSADTAVTSTIVVTAIGDRNAALLMSASNTQTNGLMTHLSWISSGLPTILTVKTATRPSIALCPSGATLR